MSCRDVQVDMMMETGEDMESEVAEGTAMGNALRSSGDKVASAFNKKTKGLKVSPLLNRFI